MCTNSQQHMLVHLIFKHIHKIHMRESRIEIEDYFIEHFKRITEFDSL